MLFKVGVLKIFAKFQGLNFIKKWQVFSCEVCEIFKNTFFTEHLRATASVNTSFEQT